MHIHQHKKILIVSLLLTSLAILTSCEELESYDNDTVICTDPDSQNIVSYAEDPDAEDPEDDTALYCTPMPFIVNGGEEILCGTVENSDNVPESEIGDIILSPMS